MPKHDKSHKSNEHRFSPYVVSNNAKKEPPKENKKRAREETVTAIEEGAKKSKKLKTSHVINHVEEISNLNEPLNNPDVLSQATSPHLGMLVGLGCGGAPSYFPGGSRNLNENLRQEADRLLNQAFDSSIKNNNNNHHNPNNPNNPEINFSPKVESSITNKIIVGIGSILFSAVATTIGYRYVAARAAETEALNLIQNNSTSQKTLINLVDKIENVATLNLLKKHPNCQRPCKEKLGFAKK